VLVSTLPKMDTCRPRVACIAQLTQTEHGLGEHQSRKGVRRGREEGGVVGGDGRRGVVALRVGIERRTSPVQLPILHLAQFARFIEPTTYNHPSPSLTIHTVCRTSPVETPIPQECPRSDEKVTLLPTHPIEASATAFTPRAIWQMGGWWQWVGRRNEGWTELRSGEDMLEVGCCERRMERGL